MKAEPRRWSPVTIILGWLARPINRKILVNLIILVLLILFFAVQAENFTTANNVRNVARQISVVGIMTAAVTLVMVSGGLDLSVGSVAAFAGVVAAMASSDMPVEAAFTVGVLAGAAFGIVNGLLVVYARINPVIATLGTMNVARGVANVITDGLPVSDIAENYGTLGTGFVGEIPIPVIVLLLVVVILTLVERRTLLGKHAIAIGSNQEAARLSGVRVKRVQIGVYTLSGLMAGIAGVVVSSRLNSGQPNLGIGFEFDTIVAAILGGTALSGGEGSVPGSLLGVVIIGVVKNGLNLMGVQTFWQTIVQGVVLLLAVGFDSAFRERLGTLFTRDESTSQPKGDRGI